MTNLITVVAVYHLLINFCKCDRFFITFVQYLDRRVRINGCLLLEVSGRLPDSCLLHGIRPDGQFKRKGLVVRLAVIHAGDLPALFPIDHFVDNIG